MHKTVQSLIFLMGIAKTAGIPRCGQVEDGLGGCGVCA